eukprot:1864936-Rhodomonas_salina.2
MTRCDGTGTRERERKVEQKTAKSGGKGWSDLGRREEEGEREEVEAGSELAVDAAHQKLPPSPPHHLFYQLTHDRHITSSTSSHKNTRPRTAATVTHTRTHAHGAGCTPG